MRDIDDAELREVLPRLRRFALHLAREQAAADDLVQSCLERALSRWSSRRPEGSLKAWLFTVVAPADETRAAEIARVLRTRS